jgi:uncharacterized membrane protein SpoIIM required for sporulation/ABC-type transport system involved in multi-copper enzyme maturation permease subunit
MATIIKETHSRPFSKTLSNALIITRREVRDSFRDWRIIAPIVVLTFFFPFLAQSVAANFSAFVTSYGAQIIGERTIPFLLMIVGFFPISISLVIALETFVGEKERRSLEPLLSTPLSNTELYIGKTLAAMIPPLIASFGGMTVYLMTLLGGVLAWRPPAMLIVQIFLLTIVQALVMVTGAVVVSSQTTSTRASNLLASFIIIPMTLIINGESIIMFLAPDATSESGISALWAIIAGMVLVVILLLRMGNAIFNREELLGRMIDQINIVGTIKKIGSYIVAIDDKGTPAKNIVQFYTHAIPYSLGKLRIPVMITIGVFVVALLAGYIVGMLPDFRLTLPPQSQLSDTLGEGTANQSAIELFRQFSGSELQREAFMAIVWQNGRVLLAAALLSAISFGVAGYIIVPIVYVVLGYVLAQMVLNGYTLTLFFGALLPHGIVEIPIIILATAVMFRLGTVITRPPKGATLGHAWIMALGDTIKLTLGVLIPGLIIAALLEVSLTPWVVANLL